jgi:xylan 1,4-beta-xylosidase
LSDQQPIIAGFHPDPSACRVGDTFFLACSSFEYFPGIPLFRSDDLRKWEQIGHVLDRPSQLNVSEARPSAGIFAPTLRHHDGRLWMITTNIANP